MRTRPRHAACFTVGVAFQICEWMLAAPGAWVCALADMAVGPNTSNAAVNVIVSFFKAPSLVLLTARVVEKYCGTATTNCTLFQSLRGEVIAARVNSTHSSTIF